jgi:hypothetical protein
MKELTRWELINLYIFKYKYQSYLEIGIRNRWDCYEKVIAFHKEGVDPNPMYGCTHEMTSDEYFKQLDPNKKFDIIFIDGLHIKDQVMKDIINSLNHLNDNGVILLHDCLPLKEEHQFPEDNGSIWNGDVWKAVAELRCTRNDLRIRTINTDYGIGEIKKSFSPLYIPIDTEYLTWNYFEKHKEEMMNIVTPPDLNLLNI